MSSKQIMQIKLFVFYLLDRVEKKRGKKKRNVNWFSLVWFSSVSSWPPNTTTTTMVIVMVECRFGQI